MRSKVKIIAGLLIAGMIFVAPVKAMAIENNDVLQEEYLETLEEIEWNEPPLAEGELIMLEGEPHQLSVEELLELGLIDEKEANRREQTEFDLLGSVGVDYSQMTQSQIMNDIEQRIRDALLNNVSTIDLYGSGLNTKEHSYLNNIMYYCPYADGQYISIRCPYYSDGSYAYVGISNSLDNAATVDRISTIDAAINDYIDTVKGGSDLEVALKLHDEIAVRCQYSNPITLGSYYPYSMYTDGKGVCQAYAYMYMYLLTKLNIESGYISSTAINHAWNVVNIDGDYYHVDITWDDPLKDKFGQAKHIFFLVSDETMASRVTGSGSYHTGWDMQFTCNNSKFDDAFWYKDNAISPITYYAGDYYYITNDCYMHKYNLLKDTRDSVLYLGKWHTFPNQYGGTWSGCYSGLFLWDGLLYYNNENSIMTYNPATGEKEKFADGDITSGFIYGMRKNGNTIQYITLDNPNSAYSDILTCDKTLPVIPTADPVSVSISEFNLAALDDGSLTLNYYVDVTGGSDGMMAELRFTDGNACIVEYSDLGRPIETNMGIDKYKFSMPVPAKRLKDKVQLRVYNDDEIDENVAYSIAEIADIYLKDSRYSAKTRKVMVSMLNYGAESQKYFGYELDDLANAGLTAEQKTLENTNFIALQNDDDVKKKGLDNYIGSSLILDSDITIRHYFTSNDIMLSDGNVLCSYNKNGNLYYIDVDTNIFDVSKQYSLYDEPMVNSIEYSILNYMAKAQQKNDNLIPLMHSIYDYSVALNIE